MPAAIGAAILGEVLAGTVIVGSLTLGTVVGNAVIIGGSLMLSRALSNKARTGTEASKSQQFQAVISDALAPRRKFYGIVKVSGVRAFFDVKGGALYQIIMINHGEIKRFREWWLGDQYVETTGGEAGGDVTTNFFFFEGVSNVFLEAHTGSDDQPASPTMLDFWPDVWTEDHRLRGIAYILAIFKGVASDDFSTIFPQSYNTPVRAVIEATRVWDPRDPAQVYGNKATYQWSENAGIIILDFILDVDGLRKPASQVDIESFIGFSDRCFELVSRVGDEPERRYRCWGGYTLADDPKTVLQGMLDACDAELYETVEGKIAIRGGGWADPVFTITDADILAPTNFERGNSKLAEYNELKPVFPSLNHDFQMIETDPWIDDEAQAAQGRIAEDFALDWVPSWTQARRLAKIKMHRDNPRWRGTITTTRRGLALMQPQQNKWDWPIFRLQYSVLGIDETFVVTTFQMDLGTKTCKIGVASLSAAAYEWDPETEEGDEPPPPQDTRPTV